MPRACRYCWRTMKSSGASSTWPPTRPWSAEHVVVDPHEPALARRPRRPAGWRRRATSAPARPRAGRPAAMAPEVTTTTWWPAARSGGHLGAELARWRRRRSSPSVVGDRRRADLRRPTVGHASVLVLEGRSRRCARCRPRLAPARASARSTPRRRSRSWAYVEGLGVGEVGEGDGPLGLAARPRRSRRRRSRSTGMPSAHRAVHDEGVGPATSAPAPRAPASAIARPARATPVAGDGRDARSPSRRRLRLAARRPSSRRRAGAARAARAGSGRARRAGSRSCSCGRAAVDRRQVDEHDQHAGPLDVAEELVAEALALAGPLDEPGDVGDHDLGSSSRRHTPRLARGW